MVSNMTPAERFEKERKFVSRYGMSADSFRRALDECAEGHGPLSPENAHDLIAQFGEAFPQIAAFAGS